MDSRLPWTWKTFALRERLAMLALVFLGVLAYAQVVQLGWIWDDDNYVTANATLTSLAGLADIWLRPGATPQYYPMVHSSFWLEYRLWGLAAAGYHATNLMLHLLAGLLLWRLLVRLRVPGAWLGAAIFLVHPLGIESVAWVTERKNTLGLAFYLGALLMHWRFVVASMETVPRSRVPRLWAYGGALLLFVGAMLSKTVACSWPVVVLLLLWWRYPQWSVAHWRQCLSLLPHFAIGAGLARLTVRMERETVGALGHEWSLTLWERAMVAGRILWFYLGKLCWPAEQSFIYPRWPVSQLGASDALWGLTFLALLAALWWARRYWGRGPLVALLIYGATLFPALGFFNVYPMRYSFVADHFQHFSGLVVMTLLAAGLHALACRWRWLRPAPEPNEGLGQMAPAWPWRGAALSAVVLLPLMALTVRHLPAYTDEESLWRATLKSNPRAWMANNNLGLLLLEREAYEDAAQCFIAARDGYRLDYGERHQHDEATNNLARALEGQGRFEEALTLYRELLTRRGDDTVFTGNLAYLLARMGRHGEAMELFRQTLSRDNRNFQAWVNLGTMLAEMGRYPEADRCFNSALSLEPKHQTANFNWGLSFVRRGDRERAAQLFTEVLRANPDHPDAHYELARYYQQKQVLDGALFHVTRAVQSRDDFMPARVLQYEVMAEKGQPWMALQMVLAVLRDHPEFVQGHFDHGFLSQRLGQPPERAIGAYREALARQPKYPEAHFNLASVLVVAGQVGEGEAHYRLALEQRPEWRQAEGRLAWVLAAGPGLTPERAAEALRLAELACQRSEFKDPRHLDELAAALAAAGRPAEAVTRLQEAIALLGPEADAKLLAELNDRLARYRAGQRYELPQP